ncbi:hypothetical protein SBOR_5340 [Sclerotinia borealis F-4128]|uniref:Ubiquitin-like domain-containing protein n=1 Tax=Sclerotinia borealis (strain F-4128) TaxID=1432307 RepID=W9CBX5_SCLBF|nr:hypothetical protein SBOR_5340 [Sclerotinia borealis F-4128]
MAGFGWSAGDLVAAISVAVKVSKALKDAGGAKEDYRESVAFLESLSVTLQVLHKYYGANLNQNDFSAVEAQMLLIQDPIDAFTKSVKLKYEPELGTQPRAGYRAGLKGVSKKIQWALWMNKESERLSSKISTPLAAIQMRLSIQIISIVSAVPGDISTKIEGVMRTAIPELLEHALAPLRALAKNSRMDQLTASTIIEQKLDLLPDILTRSREPEMEATRTRDNRRSQEMDEHYESLSNKIIQAQNLLQHGIAAVPRQLSITADSVIQELHVLSEATVHRNRLIDHRLENIQKQLCDRERVSNINRRSINVPGSRNQTMPNDNALLEAVEATASGSIRAQSSFYLADNAGRDPWREAGDHFHEFIRLLLHEFYRLFIQLWYVLHVQYYLLGMVGHGPSLPMYGCLDVELTITRPLFTSFLIQLKVMKRCIVRLPSLLSKEDITFIDILGKSRRLPYTTYGNLETFNRFLRAHYQGIPGESKILSREYTITSQDGHLVQGNTWQKYTQPNAVISMAIVLSFNALWGRCPKCGFPVNEKYNFGRAIMTTCSNRDCLLEFCTIAKGVTSSTTDGRKIRFDSASSSSSVEHNTGFNPLSIPTASTITWPKAPFPIWLEVAKSLKKVEYSNMRQKVDALALSSPVNQNIHFTSDAPEPYRHLLHAEKIEIPNRQVSEIETFTELVTARKKEIADLEHYFKRVHCISESPPPCRLCSFKEYRHPDDMWFNGNATSNLSI